MDSTRERFKYARQLRKMTQRAVGEHFDVAGGTVYRWESGVFPLTLPILEAAADLFEVDRVWLVFGQGAAPVARPADESRPAVDDEPHEGAA